jgi:hypothetical protein
VDNWTIPSLDLRPIMPGRTTVPSWPLEAQEITAEDGADGGTFYRPEKPTWINGTDDPSATAGDEGDYFLNTQDIEWWGPKGAENEDGEGSWPGPYVLPIGTWTTGTADPSDLNGNPGDYYLDTASHAYWGPKTDTWADTGPVYIHDAWLSIVAGPVASGVFSLPMVEVAVGDPDSEETTSTFFELADTNGRRIVLIDIGELTADSGTASGLLPAFMAELDYSQTIAKARWKIIAGKGTVWSSGGTLTKIR